jgi:UDP-3-O-[3-hydroxymyristoyl] glucosamine N-acyltransferase
MADLSFFSRPEPLSLGQIAELTGAELASGADRSRMIHDVAALGDAGPCHVAFYDNLRYEAELQLSHAAACFVSPKFAGAVPSRIVALVTRHPFRAFVELARTLHPDALRPGSDFRLAGIAASAVIHETAHLEDEVTIDPLAVIGPDVEIGSGTVIGAGVVIGQGVRIGRDCSIGSNSSIAHTLIGDNVIIHPGCRIGQDGFGFVSGPRGHSKVPQTGRVIIQHHVEIGAGCSLDRGSLRDTVIGEGTKIDNQVQVGHNVTIGRHTVIAAQAGFAGSLTIGNYVAVGAKAGLNNHIEVGDGAMIAAMSGVKDSVPAGQRWGGYFARPSMQWFREIVALERLGREGSPRAEKAAKKTV